jgi:hypothetical protein
MIWNPLGIFSHVLIFDKKVVVQFAFNWRGKPLFFEISLQMINKFAETCKILRQMLTFADG